MRNIWKMGGGRAHTGWVRLPAWAWIAVACMGWAGVAMAADAKPEVGALVSAVVENQRTTGSRTRARVSIEPAKGPERSMQVLIKSRRDGATNETLVMVMWPRVEKGRAWMIRRTGSGEISGFRLIPPDSVFPVAAADLDEPLFGSDLSVDDFAESFWDWPDQRLAGEEKVGNTDCWIVDSHIGQPGARHPRIRSWLAKEKPVALRVEKFGADGVLGKRLTAGRVVRQDEGGWAVAEWTVETIGTGSRTKVSGSRSERDLALPASEFTPDGVQQLIER